MPQPAGVALSPLAQAAGGTSVTFGGDELCSGFLRPRPVSKTPLAFWCRLLTNAAGGTFTSCFHRTGCRRAE
jgi:hypothetical protein